MSIKVKKTEYKSIEEGEGASRPFDLLRRCRKCGKVFETMKEFKEHVCE